METEAVDPLQQAVAEMTFTVTRVQAGRFVIV